MDNTISEATIQGYAFYLFQEEKSPATMEKYLRYARDFANFLGPMALQKEALLAYKKTLMDAYSAAGTNGILAAINSLVVYLGKPEWKVRSLRIQKHPFVLENRQLARDDFTRLVQTARRLGKHRLEMILQTLHVTGMRVSELQFITTDSVKHGGGEIHLKGKIRWFFLPEALCHMLEAYAAQEGIQKGQLFITKYGNGIDRSNLWKEMKCLAEEASVHNSKVFPHNIRKLFARTYYTNKPDLAELADLLGHSDVNTTRIYTATTTSDFQERLKQMELVI